jgi:hypothetical protein
MKMKSAQPGTSISPVDVGNVTRRGFWLLLDESEHFLPFEQFPWFRNASIEALTTIERPSSHHLYWPMLDVDLAVDSIIHPDRYPLVSRAV